jgi:copper chaperone CopZ
MTRDEDAYGTQAGENGQVPPGKVASTVLHVGGLGWASEKAVVEQVLGRRPGVRMVEANPVSQTATVTFDTSQNSVAELRRWVEECGYHCAGQSVPSHVCDPLAEPGPPAAAAGDMPAEHVRREIAGTERAPSAQAMMGHGGAAGM